MRRKRHLFAAVAAMAFGLAVAVPAAAQKPGGVLRVYHRDSPASMSILEEATLSVLMPVMGVFNNLVIYDQHVAQNSLAAVRPELATEWSWNEAGIELTFRLRHDVRWHDGKPFTAADVKCTWDLLLGKGSDKLRLDPRRSWYDNVKSVEPDGEDRVRFVLTRPQPALLALLASGWSPVYPCHIAPAQMRQHPIGTGPFKFVEYKQNERIVVGRNPDYWKQGRPYLDGIEYTIVPNRSTALLGFMAGKFDLTVPFDVSIPLLKDVREQAPQADCVLAPLNATRNVIVNREAPPFDNPEVRRAIQLSLDRKAFIDILGEGDGEIGGAMLPPPAGIWGLPLELLRDLPGYGPDVAQNRAEARALMAKAGYGPEKPVTVKLVARNIAIARDPAVILIDQLKTIGIDAELEPVETASWYPKLARKDYVIGLNLTANAVDDPDQHFFEHYSCHSDRNVTGYCNPAIEEMFVRQSSEFDQEKRKQLVWEIDRRLQQDGARPIIFHYKAATCMQPAVKNLTVMVNSIYNSWRFEDVWLDR
jgi:peptide/nickel transport system substrate-binding protein